MKKLKLIGMTQADYVRQVWRLSVEDISKREAAKTTEIDFASPGMRAWDLIEMVCESRQWMLHFIVICVYKNNARVNVVALAR